MHISFFVPLTVCSVLLFHHVSQGSGTVVRRRRVRKHNNSQENQRSARKLDLDKISINQDFNTEFVKAFLYGDTEKSVQREEGIRPVFATRRGEHRIMKNLEMRHDDAGNIVTDTEDVRIGRLLDFPFNSVENKNHRSFRSSHKNGLVPTFVPTSFKLDSLHSDALSNNLEELGDNIDFYNKNEKDENKLNNDKPSGGANKVVQEFNDYDYEEHESVDAQSSNYERSASSKEIEHKFVEVFDDSQTKNIHEFDTHTEEDILITPNNHNGNLPYHLEGTIGRLSKETANPVEHSTNTAKVNFAFSELSLRGNEQTHPDTSLRIRGAFKNEASVDGIIRFNGKEKISSYRRNDQGHQNQKFSRESRQGSDNDSGAKFDEVASASADTSGQKCINKVVLETETQYDEIIECKHSYDKRCHTTFSTDYEPTQEEKCNENFRKNCFIEYSTTAYNETVQICRQPLLKDCNLSGPEICRTEYESECWTRNEVHDVTDDSVECTEVKEEKCEDETSGYTTQQKCSLWPVQKCEIQKKQVKKFSPKTKCTKVPKELCAPTGCGFTPGPEECYDKVQTVLGQHPEENCSLEPQTTCKHVTKLVPKLVAREECLDVPKEVCTRSKSNPRRIQKPVVKKWCYTPSEESGLA